MFRLKFDQKNIINEEFDFFEGQGRGEEERDLHFKIVLSIIIGKHVKMFLFKFNRNRIVTMNCFFEEGGGKVARRGPPILICIIIY